MDKDKSWTIIRILIIIVPWVLSFFLLFSPFEKVELTREKITENMTVVKVSNEEIFKPTLKNAIRDLLNVPFGLKWYDICFVNEDTKFVYLDGREDKNVTVTLNLNNQTEFVVPYGETKCIPQRFDKDFTYKWGFTGAIDFKSSELEMTKECIPHNETHKYCFKKTDVGKLHLDVYSYAQPELKSIIVKNLLVLISWCGIIWLFTRILKFIRFGIWES